MKAESARRAERFTAENSGDLLNYFLRRVPDREDAADLLAETLLVMWKRIRHMPSDDAEARPWLFGVARRVLSHYHRAGVRRQRLADSLRAQVAAAGQLTVPSAEARVEVQGLLAQLTEKDREIVLLHAWEGFTHEEIASIVGMKAASVRSRYARARSQLVSNLSKESQSASGP